MNHFAGVFETLAADQHDARLASRKALVLSRDRIDARLGKFLAASKSPVEFDARYDLVADDFEGIVRVAAREIGHDGPDTLVETLRAHYADKDHWIQDAVKKPGDLHKKLDVPEGEKIPEEKIENAEETGDKNLKEKAQFAENVKKGSTQKKGKKCSECKDKNHDDCSGGDCSCKKCNVSDDDEEDCYKSSSTRGAVPLVRTADEKIDCESCGGEGCPGCAFTGKGYPKGKNQKEIEESDAKEKESSVHVADEGNTGLSGPSPKMKKQRWTPKSVRHDEYDEGKDGIGDHKEKDVLEVQPKKNLTGPAKDVPETGKAKEEKLPAAKGLDDSGFEPSKNTGDSGPTKTFPKGNQADPVTKPTVEKE